MSVLKANILEFSTETIGGVAYAKMCCNNKNFKKTVENRKCHEALLDLAKEHLKVKVSPKLLTLCRLILNGNFLNALTEYVAIEEGSIEYLLIQSCQVHLSQEEIENFICPLRLKGLAFSLNNFHNGIEINDKICSVETDLQISSHLPGVVYPQITDNLLEEWKSNPPSVVHFINNVRTFFTMKSVAELVLYVLKNEMSVDWTLGTIECQANDGKYLLELQKVENTLMKIGPGGCYEIIPGKIRNTHDAPSNDIYIQFNCVFV